MNTIRIADLTLRVIGDKKLSGGISFREKLEIASLIDRLKVNIIELPPLSGEKADALANKTIASTVKSVVSASVEIGSGMIEETWESIRGARSPQLNLNAPVSTVQMEYMCHKKAPAMLELIKEQVKLCRFFCEKVEFTAVDATRADYDFLVQAFKAAEESGAEIFTICDTAGVMLPDEFGKLVADLYRDVPALAEKEVFVVFDNSMGMALASAAAAIRAGANGFKCTAVKSDLPSYRQAAVLFEKKGEELDIRTDLNTTVLLHTVDQIRKISVPQLDSETPFRGTGMGESPDVSLYSTDSMATVMKAVEKLGYDLSEEDHASVYEAFLRVANKKHFVGTKELEAIIATSAMQVPSSYRLDNYVVNSGNIITATANVLIEKDGEKIRGVGVGDGPVDAAFLAIENILGHHYEVDDFQIQTVTAGRDAMGSALVKLRANGRIYSGSGISTDIIGASIRAYLSALNKIVYDMA